MPNPPYFCSVVKDALVRLSLRRWLQLLAAIFVAAFAGCATTEQLEGPNPSGRDRVFIPSGDQIVTNAKLPSFVRWAPGKNVKIHGPLLLRKEFYNSVISYIEWSNGYLERLSEGWYTAKGRSYAVLAVELNTGQRSRDVTIEVKSLGDEMAESSWSEQGWKETGAMYAYLAFLPIMPLFTIPSGIYEAYFRAKERPFDECCFMWVVDVATGETVAGSSPTGARVIFSEFRRLAIPPEVPRDASVESSHDFRPN